MNTIRTSLETLLKSLSLLAILFCFSQYVAAQSSSTSPEIDHNFQVSFVPGVSSSDSYSTSRFSFNILGGYNGAFHGFEFGSIFNGNRYDISGIQISGIANVNRQQARGVLFSGIINYTETFSGGLNLSGTLNMNREEARGLLLSGVMNYTDRFTKGFMGGGSINISRGETNGVLLSGGLNYAGTQNSGLMVTGGVNIANEARGVSISTLNIAEKHSGVQLGVMNISGKQTGTQIGIINVVGEESEGTSLGLLSFVEGGRFNVDVWSNETGFVNGGVRIGTEKIYNVVNVGYNPFHGVDLWQVGIGIGYYQELDDNGNGIETDLMHQHINHNGKWTSETSSHVQWRFHYTRKFTKSTGIFSGPSLNVLIADENLSDSFIPYTIHERTGGNTLRWWGGWTLGIELF